MSQIDPTYLRFIYNDLKSGILNRVMPFAIPEGLSGLFQKSFTGEINLNERKEYLEFLCYWAIIKREVSPEFISEISGLNHYKVIELINKKPSWFNRYQSGTYQLYHERLKIFILQNVSAEIIDKINNRIINVLVDSHNQKDITSEKQNFISNILLDHFLLMSIKSKINVQYFKIILSDEWQRQFYKSYLNQKECINSLSTLNYIANNLNEKSYSIYAAYISLKASSFYWENLLLKTSTESYDNNLRQELLDSTNLFENQIIKFTILFYSLLLAQNSKEEFLIAEALKDLSELLCSEFDTEISCEIGFYLLQYFRKYGFDWENAVKNIFDLDESFVDYVIKNKSRLVTCLDFVKVVIQNKFANLIDIENDENIYLLLILYKEYNENELDNFIVSILQEIQKKVSKKALLITKILVLDIILETSILESLEISNNSIIKKASKIIGFTSEELKRNIHRTKSDKTLILILAKSVVINNEVLIIKALERLSRVEYFSFLSCISLKYFNKCYDKFVDLWLNIEDSVYTKMGIKIRYSIWLIKYKRSINEGLNLIKDVKQNLIILKDNLSAEKIRIISIIKVLFVREELYEIDSNTKWFFKQVVSLNDKLVLRIASQSSIFNFNFFESVYCNCRTETFYLHFLSLNIYSNDRFDKLNYLLSASKVTISSSFKQVNELLLQKTPKSVLKFKDYLLISKQQFSVDQEYNISNYLKFIAFLDDKNLQKNLYDLFISDNPFNTYLDVEALNSYYKIKLNLGYSKRIIRKIINKKIDDNIPDHIRCEQLKHLCRFELKHKNFQIANYYWSLQKSLLSSDPVEMVLSANDVLYTAHMLNDNKFLSIYFKNVESNNIYLDYFYSELAILYYELGDNVKYLKFLQLAMKFKSKLYGFGSLTKAYLYNSTPELFLIFLSTSWEYGNLDEIFLLSIKHFKIIDENELIKYIYLLKSNEIDNSEKELSYLFKLGENIDFDVSYSFLLELYKIDRNYLHYFLSAFTFNKNSTSISNFVKIIHSSMNNYDLNLLGKFVYQSLFENQFDSKYKKKAKQLFSI